VRYVPVAGGIEMRLGAALAAVRRVCCSARRVTCRVLPLVRGGGSQSHEHAAVSRDLHVARGQPHETSTS
jgi:hypothetical protein